MAPVVVFVIDREVLETSSNKETIAHFNAQRRMGKKSVTLENHNSTQSTPKNMEVIMPNSGSNDSELNAIAGMIDHTIDYASPTLEGSDMVTNNVLNFGFLNTNPIMNANPVETVVLERKLNTLETTLKAETHVHHVTINLDQDQLSPSTVECGEQPKNIRSWKEEETEYMHGSYP